MHVHELSKEWLFASYVMLSDVRKGSELSPCLFNLFVNNIITRLMALNIGC